MTSAYDKSWQSLECWSTGVLEWWTIVVKFFVFRRFRFPVLHYSNTPFSILLERTHENTPEKRHGFSIAYNFTQVSIVSLTASKTSSTLISFMQIQSLHLFLKHGLQSRSALMTLWPGP